MAAGELRKSGTAWQPDYAPKSQCMTDFMTAVALTLLTCLAGTPARLKKQWWGQKTRVVADVLLCITIAGFAETHTGNVTGGRWRAERRILISASFSCQRL